MTFAVFALRVFLEGESTLGTEDFGLAVVFFLVVLKYSEVDTSSAGSSVALLMELAWMSQFRGGREAHTASC